MSRRVGGASSDAVASETVEERLSDGATALEAVVAAYFAKAAIDPGVLLSPTALLVGGMTGTARCFDGRSRQPGSRIRRVRRYADGAAVPAAAKVAVPNGVRALLVGYAYAPGGSLQRLLRPALKRVKGVSSDRERLLRRVSQVGARVFSEPEFVRPFLHEADESHGGVLTGSDFKDLPTTLDEPAMSAEVGDLTLLSSPWAEAELEEDGAGRLISVTALDAVGGAASLTFSSCGAGLYIPELDLRAPQTAIVNRPGVSRTAPGAPLPFAAEAALVTQQGRIVGAIAGPSPGVIPDAEALRRAEVGVYRQDRVGHVGTTFR